jgi:hypothetical protein
LSDHLYLSLWLATPEGELWTAFEQALALFPTSYVNPTCTVRVYALEMVEPPLAEIRLEEADASLAVAAAREFENDDCAYEVECHWDLWQRGGKEWKLLPAPVRIVAYGPAFESPSGEQLQADVGMDYLYLPSDDGERAGIALRSNLKSLLRLANDWESSLAVERRLLWSETGDDLADRIEQSLSGEQSVE